MIEKKKKILILAMIFLGVSLVMLSLAFWILPNLSIDTKDTLLKGAWESQDSENEIFFSDYRFLYTIDHQIGVGTFEVLSDHSLVFYYSDGNTRGFTWANSSQETRLNFWHITEDTFYFGNSSFRRTEEIFDFSILDNWTETLTEYDQWMPTFIDALDLFLMDVTNTYHLEAYIEMAEEFEHWLIIMEAIELTLQEDEASLFEFMRTSQQITEQVMGVW
jgi:hypothetical protein